MKRTIPRAPLKMSMADKLDWYSMPEPNSGCLLWLGKSDTPGYGVVAAHGQKMRASRAAWTISRGPIPAGMQVLHKCDVRACVNPDHLFLGTHADNMADMARKGRCPSYRGEKHPQAKLTDAQRLAVASDPRPQSEIARSYGIGQPMVSMLKSGARKVL